MSTARAKMGSWLSRAVTWALLGLVYGYRYTLGPLMGGQCRFQPTCSQYALDALRAHGAMKGSWLTACRLARCHPLGGSGYDPVREAGRGESGSVSKK